MGTSAGGIETLRLITAALPATFPAAVCVVIHLSPQSPGVLASILDRSGALTALFPENGERLQPGRIYIAPRDHHLLIEPGRVRVTKGPRENGFRPAIDPLFRSAAQVYGPNAIGVILTGNLDDGTAGLWAIKRLGGTAVVQDPRDAIFPAMPASALAHVTVDHVVPLDGIAPLLTRLVTEDAPQTSGGKVVPEYLDIEVDIAKEKNAIEAGLMQVAAPSSFACPDCHGVLLQFEEGGRLRFRCHTGHAYSVESLLAGINNGIEESLWNAIRAIEEGELLMKRMAEHVSAHRGGEPADLREAAAKARERADALRRMVSNQQAIGTINL